MPRGKDWLAAQRVRRVILDAVDDEVSKLMRQPAIRDLVEAAVLDAIRDAAGDAAREKAQELLAPLLGEEDEAESPTRAVEVGG